MVIDGIAELNAVACCISKPELAAQVYEYIQDTYAKSIVYSLTGLADKTDIPLAVLMQLTSLKKQVLMQYYNAQNDIPTDEVDQVFESALVTLKEAHTYQMRCQGADAVAIKIKANLIGEAYKQLDELAGLGQKQPFNDIFTDMKNSLDKTNGFLTGIKAIDDKGGWYKSNIVSFFGDTGSLKTYISLHVCLEILLANPTYTCIYFEKEMPVADVARRLITRITPYTLSEVMSASLGSDANMKNGFLKTMIDDAMAAKNPLTDAFHRIKIIGPNDFNTATDIHKIVMKYKPDIWCIDYLSLIETNDSDSNRGVSNMLKQLKTTVHQSESLGILLSQIKHNTIESRNNKIPTKSDIEWGSQVRQFSSNMYATFYPSKYYRKDVDPKWYFLVDTKSRNSEGRSICLHCNPKRCNFAEVNSDDESFMREWLDGYMIRMK